MEIKQTIQEQVHSFYYDQDMNCARTTLQVLSTLFNQPIEKQVMQAAVALHGLGGSREQCGLVEGSAMFLGLFFLCHGWDEERVVALTNEFAHSYVRRFGSVRCYDLRPGGFSDNDAPHLCENLSVESIFFTYQFILQHSVEEGVGMDY